MVFCLVADVEGILSSCVEGILSSCGCRGYSV